jgi:hypothetical protein
VIAYKKLRLFRTTSGNIYGFSPTQFAVWYPDETCLPCLELFEDVIREPGSSAGIYAVTDKSASQLVTYDGDVVALWLSGYVVEHAQGYRASKARVMEIHTATGLPTPLCLADASSIRTRLTADIRNQEIYRELTAYRDQTIWAERETANAKLFADLDQWIQRTNSHRAIEVGITKWLAERPLTSKHVDRANARVAMKANTQYCRRYGVNDPLLIDYVKLRGASFLGVARDTHDLLEFLADVDARYDPSASFADLGDAIYRYVAMTSSVLLRALWLVVFGLKSRDFVMFIRRCNSVDAILRVAAVYGRAEWTDIALARMEITNTQLYTYTRIPLADADTLQTLREMGLEH